MCLAIMVKLRLVLSSFRNPGNKKGPQRGLRVSASERVQI
jgi:hypothetical protein